MIMKFCIRLSTSHHINTAVNVDFTRSSILLLEVGF